MTNSQTLNAHSEDEEQIVAAPDKASKQSSSQASDDGAQGNTISLQTKIQRQFKAMEELKDKKKVLDDVLKQAEEQNTVIQEILEEIDEKKDLLKGERQQFQAQNLETVDKIKNIKKELKEEGELLSDMLLTAYERREEVILQGKDGKQLVIKVEAKLTLKK